MSKHFGIPVFALSWALAGQLALAVPQEPQEPSDSAGTKPNADNTRMNKRDRNKGEPTADQAKNNKSDREIMQKIRKSVMDDKSLSTYAHNVKIISQGGKVTLKGPVRSDEERQQIQAKAVEVAGEGNVTNQLTVKGEKTAKHKY